MPWITLTEDDLLTRLTGTELTAVQTKALAAGQDDPVPEEIASVIQEVRGRVAACSANTLGDGDTIPAELKPAALAIARYRVLARLPVSSLVTPQREKEYNDALALLVDVAACRFRVEQPATPTTQDIAGPISPQLVDRNPSNWDAGAQDGV